MILIMNITYVTIAVLKKDIDKWKVMFSSGNGDNDNQIIQFISTLTISTFAMFVLSLVMYFCLLGEPMSWFYLGFGLAMLLIFISLAKFVKSLVPPELNDDIEKMAEEEAQEMMDKIFPWLSNKNKTDKKDKENDDKDK